MITRSRASQGNPYAPTLCVIIDLDPDFSRNLEVQLLNILPHVACHRLSPPPVEASESRLPCREQWVHRILAFLLTTAWSQGVHPVVCFPVGASGSQWNICFELVRQLRQHCLVEALDILVICSRRIKGMPWAMTVKAFSEAGASATLNTVDPGLLKHRGGKGSSGTQSAPLVKTRTLLQLTTSSFPKRWIPESLKFYHNHDPWYLLTNFCDRAGKQHVLLGFTDRHSCEFYPTTEHYFQAQKFTKGDIRRKVAAAPTPRMAFEHAKAISDSFKPYWDGQCRCGAIYKERVMLKGLLYKFSEKKPLARYSLLATGTCQLVEDSFRDAYWGIGHGDGHNRLGYLLELVRFDILKDELRRMQCRFESMFKVPPSSSWSSHH